MSWATLDHFFVFSVSHCLEVFCIKFDDRLSAHNASGTGGPLGMSSANSFFCNKGKIENLISRELHDQNGLFWLAILIFVHDWGHIDVLRAVGLQFDII